MRLPLVLALVLAAAFAAPAHAAPVKQPPVTWLKGEGNYTKSHRSPRGIRQIVVHVTEGPFWGSVKWLQSERSHASSHYIVSRRGKIIQLVHVSDIAWHAGNWRVNAVSVGIEHEGMTYDPAGFTASQYHSSARLAAYIARRALMPIDRRHIIGHAEVPNPFAPGRIGGADGHTDPGPNWSWSRYLRLVRKYAFPKPKPRPKPIRLRVSSTTLYSGQMVKGTVPWRARVSGPVRRIDVHIDGRLVLRDRRAPFGGEWNTLRVPNGRHLIELRAYGPKGAWTRKRLRVTVRNAPLVVTAAGLRRDGEVSGIVRLTAGVRGGTPRIVLVFLDGKRIDHDTRAPFAFAWDTRRVENGRHVLELHVRSRDGRSARTRLPVVVANAVLTIASQSLAEGQTVQGPVTWQADVQGQAARVEFVVDGVVRATATAAPFVWTWDTTAETAGPHALTLRAIGRDGAVVEASLTVVVAV